MYKKIFGLFAEDAQRHYTIREVARLIGVSPMTARKRLNLLVMEGLIKKKETRLSHEYRANKDNDFFKFEVQRHFIKILLDSGLIKFIERELAFPTVIYLFGSVAKGDVIKHSDMDLFAVSDEKKELDLSMFEKRIGRKINLLICTKKGFNNMKKRNPELLNNIINGVKLKGFLEAY